MLKKMLPLFFISIYLLYACSNEVNGIDRNIYNKTEEYAQIIYESVEQTNYEIYESEIMDDIVKFIAENGESENEKEKDIINRLSLMYALQTLYLAKRGDSEVKDDIDETVEFLENEYNMNIID